MMIPSSRDRRWDHHRLQAANPIEELYGTFLTPPKTHHHLHYTSQTDSKPPDPDTSRLFGNKYLDLGARLFPNRTWTGNQRPNLCGYRFTFQDSFGNHSLLCRRQLPIIPTFGNWHPNCYLTPVSYLIRYWAPTCSISRMPVSETDLIWQPESTKD